MDRKARSRLKAWLDHELPDDVARRVEESLAGAPDLREEAADFREIAFAIRQSADVTPPVPDVAVILRRARSLGAVEDRVVCVLRRFVWATAAVMLLSVTWMAGSLADSRWAMGEEPRGDDRSGEAVAGVGDGLADFLNQQERLAVLVLRDRDE